MNVKTKPEGKKKNTNNIYKHTYEHNKEINAGKHENPKMPYSVDVSLKVNDLQKGVIFYV